MRYLETDRTGLLTVLSTPRDQSITDTTESYSFPQHSPPHQRLHLLWDENTANATSLPNLIITAPGEVRDLLAWTSTYLDGYRPFTALCRVIDWDSFCCVDGTSPQSNFRIVESVCAALILAEALTHGRGRLDISSLNIPACESTFSFCKARVLYLGLAGRDDWSAKKWKVAREIAKQPLRTPATDDIEPIWSLVEAVVGANVGKVIQPTFPNLLFEMCREVATTGNIGSYHLNRLIIGHNFEPALAPMNKTREERVTAFEDMLRFIVERQLNSKLEFSFLCGYMASLLNPGSFEYIDLVTSHLAQYPTLLLWYALCEGLHPQNKILGRFGGLGRRLLRDVTMPDALISRQMCDISLEELEVLAASRGGLDYLRVAAQSSVRVELFPMVYSTLRVIGVPQGGEQISLFGTHTESHLPGWINQLGRALDKVNEIYDKFSGTEQLSKDARNTRGKRGRKA